MENRREDEIQDISISTPTIGSMQNITASNGFGHNIEFMSPSYFMNKFTEINIKDETINTNKDTLPIFLKVVIHLFSFSFHFQD